MMPFYVLPTKLARRIATKIGLISESATNTSAEMDVLREFQQIAIASDFEGALIAYVEIDLTPEQLEGLEIIYTSTKPWLMGHLVGEVLTKIEGKPNEVAAIAMQIMNGGEGLDNKSLDKLLGKLLK